MNFLLLNLVTVVKRVPSKKLELYLGANKFPPSSDDLCNKRAKPSYSMVCSIPEFPGGESRVPGRESRVWGELRVPGRESEVPGRESKVPGASRESLGRRGESQGGSRGSGASRESRGPVGSRGAGTERSTRVRSPGGESRVPGRKSRVRNE